MRWRRASGTGRWAPGVATTAAFAVLIGITAYWVLLLATPRPAIAPSGSLVSGQTSTGIGAARTLFGRASGATRPLLSATPGNIRVLGIVAGTERAVAVIAVDGKTAHAYGVGERVEPGMRLAAVERDHVVLERSGESIRVPAPPWTDTAVLTSGVGKPRGGTPASVPAAPVAPRPAPTPQSAAPAPARPAGRIPVPAGPTGSPRSAASPSR